MGSLLKHISGLFSVTVIASYIIPFNSLVLRLLKFTVYTIKDNTDNKEGGNVFYVLELYRTDTLLIAKQIKLREI